MDLFRGEGIPCGVVHDVAEAFAYARTVDLDPVATLTSPDGTSVDTVANPVRLSRTPVRYDLAPPRVGEHTAEIVGAGRDLGSGRGTIHEEPKEDP